MARRTTDELAQARERRAAKKAAEKAEAARPTRGGVSADLYTHIQDAERRLLVARERLQGFLTGYDYRDVDAHTAEEDAHPIDAEALAEATAFIADLVAAVTEVETAVQRGEALVYGEHAFEIL